MGFTHREETHLTTSALRLQNLTSFFQLKFDSQVLMRNSEGVKLTMGLSPSNDKTKCIKPWRGLIIHNLVLSEV